MSMKILALWNNYDKAGREAAAGAEPAVCWLTDSCLLREGRPFYVPDFDSDFRLFPTLAIRIDRLGKGIEARFARRYWGEASVWLNARACGLSRRLSEAGLPQGGAVAFDNSLILAPFFAMGEGECAAFSCTVSRNGEPQCRWEGSRLAMQPEQTIEALSRHNTLKTGDIILLGFPAEGIVVRPGDTIEIRKESAEEPQVLSHFKIK